MWLCIYRQEQIYALSHKKEIFIVFIRIWVVIILLDFENNNSFIALIGCYVPDSPFIYVQRI